MLFSSHARLLSAAALLTAATATPSTRIVAQSVNPKLLDSRWAASWIGHKGAPPRGFGVYLFRRVFELQAVPSRFVVHATADQRYELFVNGRRVATGPARGDLDHWRFETLDIAKHLAAGRNVLAAVVWNYAQEAPMAQISHQTGFLLQGDGEAEAMVNTGQSWRTSVNPAVSLLPIDRKAIFYEYFVGGPGEVVDASRYPWGWEQPTFDDQSWGEAERLTIGGPRGIRDTPARWFLVPRSIPLMEDTPERLAKVVRSDGDSVPADVLRGTAPWTIPARTKVTALVDRSQLTTAYPEIVTSGGKGATITLTYAEALQTPRADGKKGEKGNRNEIEGKVIAGLADRFLPDGGERRLFRPLWWRTFRYVQVAVETAAEPLTITDIRSAFSAYPFELKGRLESSDPALKRIFDIGWRTARLCAHETYMDTPYWEQLQYVGDTRIQALVSLYASGDDRLVRNAIELFDESRIPDGITQSRYPGELPQFIPPFSLFWIGMMHDLWWYSGDRTFIKPYLRGARGVLEWFEARVAPSGLLGKLEWWNYVDWVDAFEDGEPPSLDGGESAILSLQFALALREAADLEAAFGSAAQAATYRASANKVVAAVVKSCWDEGKGLLADTPAKRTFSQHVNLLGVLADVVPAAGRRALMTKVLDDPSLTQTTYYFKFYLFRALQKADMGDRYLDQLAPWRTMLDLGLTTWAETPEPTRSDSHAWSAHPTVDLLTIVAGIQPVEPGFGHVRIRPHLGTLTSLSATMPTPKGDVSAAYVRRGESLEATITLPKGVTGSVIWKASTLPLKEGVQTLTLR
jgi:alpha-L-rhamnosidase